jgi:hypothetical protein
MHTCLTRSGAKNSRKFYCYNPTHCHGMSASLSPSGRRLPALAGRRSLALAARRSPPPPHSSNRAKADLLHLLDLDDREEQESDDDYSLLNAPLASAVSSLGRSTCSASTHTPAPSEGMSLVLVSTTPVRMGGRTRSGEEGGWGGWVTSCSQEECQGFFCQPHESRVTLQGFCRHECGHTPTVYLP